jgi:uncharacterized SAM-binding protein YcdF (DUF218 family)
MSVRVDAIVVLGCTVREDGQPSAALARRLALGARAFHEGVAARVVVSGGRRWGSHVEGVVMERELRARQVPREAIVMELCSLSTAENCWFTAQLLPSIAAERVLVATCGWHLPRALRNFALVGIDAVAPPAAWLTSPPPSLGRRLRERMNAWADWCMMPRDSARAAKR